MEKNSSANAFEYYRHSRYALEIPVKDHPINGHASHYGNEQVA